MSAKEPDEDLVTALGLMGSVAGVACIVSEIYTVTKERGMRRRGQSQREQPGTAPRENLVEACSWWYVATCFVASTSCTVLFTIFAITLAGWTWRINSLVFPIALTYVILGTFLRPKDEGAGLKILHLQFFFVAIISAVAGAVGTIRRVRNDRMDVVALALGGIPFFLLAYWLLLKLRSQAAKLPPAELSNFLCHTILAGGVSAMAPMVFFSFEALSCYTVRSFETWKCNNTSFAAMFLSIFMSIIALISIARRTVPQGERRETHVTYSNLAILRLKMKEKVQGAFGVVTALVAMYLFSVLGVEGAPNDTNNLVGVAGTVTLSVAAVIEFTSIASRGPRSTGDDQAGITSASLGETNDVGAERRLSVGRVGDDMVIAGLV